jgi:4-oxalocrotonate tautomerase
MLKYRASHPIERETFMPIVTVKVLQGAFSFEQEQQMITDITAVFARIGGEGIRPNVQVLVEEVKSGLWGIGGNKLTREEIEARRAQRAKGHPSS